MDPYSIKHIYKHLYKKQFKQEKVVNYHDYDNQNGQA
jgi:hypothetical protein